MKDLTTTLRLFTKNVNRLSVVVVALPPPTASSDDSAYPENVAAFCAGRRPPGSPPVETRWDATRSRELPPRAEEEDVDGSLMRGRACARSLGVDVGVVA